MTSRIPSGRLGVTLVILLLFNGREVLAQVGPVFTLDFEAPPQAGGLEGRPVRFTARCLLTTSGLPERSPGAMGWSLGVIAGRACRIVHATTFGTAAGDVRSGGFRDGGFERTELTKGAGNEGVVSTVILGRNVPTTLPPSGTFEILALEIESLSPPGPNCVDCTLGYQGELVGSTGPVPLAINFQGQDLKPGVRTGNVVLCPVPCFPPGPTDPWPQYPLGETVGGGRVEGALYELCSLSAGYGAASDSILTLAANASREFTMTATLEALKGGIAGVEARSFTGTGGHPGAPYIGIFAHQPATGEIELQSSARLEMSGKPTAGNTRPIPVRLPAMLRVRSEGGALITSYSTDGKTFQDHLVLRGEGTGLGSGTYRVGMAQASGGPRPSTAVFRTPHVEVEADRSAPPQLDRVVDGFLGSTASPTVLTIRGLGLDKTVEVEVAGLKAKILKAGPTAIVVEVPPANLPLGGDIVVRTPTGNAVLPNSFFAPGKGWIRCDCNGDGVNDISDPVGILGQLFIGDFTCGCPLTMDCNADGAVDISDAISDLNFLFIDSQKMPPPPFPNPGFSSEIGPACGIDTPKVTRISTETIRAGSRFTIDGEGFSQVPGENVVLAGDAMLRVIDASPTKLLVEVEMILTEDLANLAVIRRVPDIFRQLACQPGECLDLVIGPAVLAKNLPALRLIADQNVSLLGQSQPRKDGGFVIGMDRRAFNPAEEVGVVASLILPAIQGLSPGSRSTSFTHKFSRLDLKFEEAVSELASRLELELSGGGALREFVILPDAARGEILIEPSPRFQDLLAGGIVDLPIGKISLYGPPVGRCGPSMLHPITDERAFGWCRFEELVRPCGGLPAFEYFIPDGLVITADDDIFPLSHPNNRSPGEKSVMYNHPAYCHVRRHMLWNRCQLEDIRAAGMTEIPPFPRAAWVLKTSWTSSLPPGADPGRYYSYVQNPSGTRFYLTAIHHTTKDINDWFWMDAYVPVPGGSAAGCGGRNDDIPASLAGTVWENYHLCTNVTHTQPFAEDPGPPFRSAWCGNFEFSPECPDIFDGGGGWDTCMNCHDGSTPGAPTTGCCSTGAQVSTPSGTLTLDFLFSLRTNIRIPNPCNPCGGAGMVNYSTQIQPIFNDNCGCHTGGAPPMGLNLAPGSSYGNLVNVNSTELPSMKRVLPNAPNSSYLWRKLNNTHIAVGGSGQPMPLGSWPLPDCDLQRIEQWVNEGANP